MKEPIGTNMCPIHGNAPARHAFAGCTCSSRPNENKQCCPKCKGEMLGNPDLGFTPQCKVQGNCPCHTPSQENNHSKYCECLKCFTEEPPQPKWEVRFDRRFVMDLSDREPQDQYWNVIENDYSIKSFISSLLANKIEIDEVIGMIEGMGEKSDYPDYNNGYNNALSSLKQKLLDRKK